MAEVAASDIKSNYLAEMHRRQKDQQFKKDVSDVTELNRRLQSVRDGSDHFYTEQEAELVLKEIGFYDWD